jgi:translation initiation factor IF-3
LDKAKELSLDLVQMAKEGEPVVCKLMDHGKHIFDSKKQKSASRKKQKRILIKEIKFRPVTEENDYQIKVNKIKNFLEEGNKAKVTLRFRGREMAHQNIGMDLLKRVEEDLGNIANVEQFPTLEGRQLVMMMAPNKK